MARKAAEAQAAEGGKLAGTVHLKKCKPFPNPSIFSLAVFHFVGNLISHGYKENKAGRGLEHEDLWELHPSFQANNVKDTVNRLWAEELKKPKPSLGRVIVKMTWKHIVLSAIFEAIRLAGSFTGPILLREIILWIRDDNRSMTTGILFAVGMGLGSTAVAFGKSHAFHQALCTGITVKACFNTLVYQKALVLSNSARQKRTTGEIINLMSTDAENMFQAFMSSNSWWSVPIQLTISLYLIFREVKDATWVGLGGLLMLFITLGVISGFMSKYQRLRMKAADKRVKLLNEMMQAIKIIKLMAWEKPILDTVGTTREEELKLVYKYSVTRAVMIATVMGSTLVTALATFAAFVGIYPEDGMEPESIFTALALLNMLRFPLMQLPQGIESAIKVNTSIGRLRRLLEAEEAKNLQIEVTPAPPLGQTILSISNGKFAWELEKTPEELAEEAAQKEKERAAAAKKAAAERKKTKKGGVDVEEKTTPVDEDGEETPYSWAPTLTGVNLEVKSGELVMVTGRVGCGKTSLLHAILGEMHTLEGAVERSGKAAYVPQSMFIRNATVQENITFSQPFDQKRFDRVVAACALEPDLKLLAAGSQTEIGEKGINLSGGQKARIQLARACYCQGDLYLLDDPLSAVDTHVAKKLVDDCIAGPGALLKGTTRILVTHQVQFLQLADKVVVMEGGAVAAAGSFAELQAAGKLNDLLDGAGRTQSGAGRAESVARERRVSSLGQPLEDEQSAEDKAEQTKVAKELVKEEERDKGAVSLAVYLTYWRAWGGWHLIFLMLLIYVVVQFLTEGVDFWLAVWGLSFVDGALDSAFGGGLLKQPPEFWLGIYAGATLGSVFLTTFRGIFFQSRGVVASRKILGNLVASVLKGNMAFFDTTPTGRVLNRFSRDTDMVDTQLPNLMETYLNIGWWLFGACVLISILLPWFIIPFVPIVALYKVTEYYFVPTARELQRLDAVSRSPMVSHFSETLAGITTIRASAMGPVFNARAIEYLDQNLRPQQLGQETRRWLDLRLEVVNLAVQFFTALFCVLAKDTISPQYAGLALTKSLSISAILGFMVMMRTMMETGMNAVERIDFYTHNIPAEPDTVEPPVAVPAEWPATGRVEFRDYSMRYREGLPLVLRKTSFAVGVGEKVGIVGRTGSGKSSLLAAMFRLVEGAEGSINIDGLNIAAVPLQSLRRSLAIIPQDPVLFSGTLRYNLDPFGAHETAELNQILEWTMLSSLGGLDKEISEGGDNLSMGQRQLVALARVLLRQPRILMLDEATASVDMETDAVIQRTINERILAGGRSTLLVIAHRLSTVVDSDRVLVMDAGAVAEYEDPKTLLANRSSRLSDMVDKMGRSAASALRKQVGAE